MLFTHISYVSIHLYFMVYVIFRPGILSVTKTIKIIFIN